MNFRIITAAAMAAAIVTPAAAQQQPWKVGVLVPVTGGFAGYANENKAGFELAVEEINRTGGIKGRPVVLQLLDTQSNPGQVASLTRKACDETLFIATTLSAESQVAFPVANSMKCPAIAATSAAAGLTGKDRPWTFAVMSPTNVSTPLAVNVAVKALAPKTSVVFVERQDVSANSYGTLTSEALVKNGVKDEVVTVNSTDVDFGPSMSRASANGAPDLIVISAMERGVMGLLKEYRKSQIKSKVMLTMSAFNANVGAQGELLDGIYRFALSDPEASTDPRVKRLVENFKARNNGKIPSLTTTLSYDAFLLAKEAIEKSDMKGEPATRDADRQKFVDALMKIKDLDALGGKMTMTEDRYLTSTPIVLVYKGGKWEEVK